MRSPGYNPHWARWSQIPGGSGAAAFTNTKSILLDGVDEYVLVPKNTAMDFEYNSTFSYAFWMKKTTTNTQALFGNCNGNTGGAVMRGLNVYISGTTGGAAVYFCNSYGAANGYLGVYNTAVPALNTWTHVVHTYDGSGTNAGWKVYINGTNQTGLLYDSSAPLTAGTTVTSNDWKIGGNENHFFGKRFAGNLDEVAFYNKVLSQAEVTAIYNGGASADLTALSSYADCISYWRNGDLTDSITTIVDRKGSNNGTPTNMESGDIVTDAP